MDGKKRPDGSDPGRLGAEFFAYLKKRGGMRKVSECKKHSPIAHLDPKEYIKSLDTSNIEYNISRGEKVIILMDKAWADQWMIYYGVEVPHHRGWISL